MGIRTDEGQFTLILRSYTTTVQRTPDTDKTRIDHDPALQIHITIIGTRGITPARNVAEEPSRGHAVIALDPHGLAISEECDLNQTSKGPIDLGLRLVFLDCVVYIYGEGTTFRRHAARIDGPLASHWHIRGWCCICYLSGTEHVYVQSSLTDT